MSSKSCRAYKIYSINITGVNQTVPKFVSINNASGAPSVLPVSSNSSLLNPTLDPANNTNTNSPATNSGPTDHSSSSDNAGHHHHHDHTSTIQ
jgi:hypothetical protein